MNLQQTHEFVDSKLTEHHLSRLLLNVFKNNPCMIYLHLQNLDLQHHISILIASKKMNLVEDLSETFDNNTK